MYQSIVENSIEIKRRAYSAKSLLRNILWCLNSQASLCCRKGTEILGLELFVRVPAETESTHFRQPLYIGEIASNWDRPEGTSRTQKVHVVPLASSPRATF